MTHASVEDAPSLDRKAAQDRRGRVNPLVLFAVLLIVLIVVVLASAMIGAVRIPLLRIFSALGIFSGDPVFLERDQLVLWTIRLPRIALALSVGALLATAGAMMQGLFRNPLADPALLGISGGAALAAACIIVLGDKIMIAASIIPPVGLLPVAAFLGALTTTTILYRFSTHDGRTSIATLLLGGLAIGALTSALTGFLIFTADDRQLRDITFWMLGSLSGATWTKVATIAPFLVALVVGAQFIARGLDVFVMGESEAFHVGIPVQRLKRVTTVLFAAAAGAAVSMAGVIGFVGIVVPHLLRLVIGPGHRLLLPASALFGGVLLLIADTLSRTIVAPTELPIGILTAIIGSPFFLVLLLRQRGIVGL